jgi:hypothetical protein
MRQGAGRLMQAFTVWRARRRIREIARRLVPLATVFTLGAVRIHPRHLAFWITTPSDAERDLLRASPELISEFRAALRAIGYPAIAVPDVGFEIESQEIVDRDHGGNWWYAVK